MENVTLKERRDEGGAEEGLSLVKPILGITNLYNGMILSTLSMSSRDFVLGFPKIPRTNRDNS